MILQTFLHATDFWRATELAKTRNNLTFPSAPPFPLPTTVIPPSPLQPLPSTVAKPDRTLHHQHHHPHHHPLPINMVFVSSRAQDTGALPLKHVSRRRLSRQRHARHVNLLIISWQHPGGGGGGALTYVRTCVLTYLRTYVNVPGLAFYRIFYAPS